MVASAVGGGTELLPKLRRALRRPVHGFEAAHQSGKEDGAASRVDGHFRLCPIGNGSSTDGQLGLLDLLLLRSLA